MSAQYLAYFGFKREPFDTNLEPEKLLKLPFMTAIQTRMQYVADLGGVLVVTGEVGSGKSTALRWACSHFHPSQYRCLQVIGNGGSTIDFYRQLCWEADLGLFGTSRSRLISSFKQAVRDIAVAKKQRLLIVVDEANLLRPEVFAEIHVITQFENDSKRYVTLVLAGQSSLLDRFAYRASEPLASRVIAKTHISALSREAMNDYIEHHLSVAGIKQGLFTEPAVTAIFQGSGGILRRANHLARGGLVAAVADGAKQVSAEHIRAASTELIKRG
jgi:general secretion pathway protein A